MYTVCESGTHYLWNQLIVLDLSLEFLMGRALDNAMLNVEQKDIATSKIGLQPTRFVMF